MKTMGLLTLYWAEYSKCNVLLWGCKVAEGIDVPCLGMNPLLFYRRMHCSIAQSNTLGFLCSWHRHSLYRCGHLCWQQSIVMLLDSAVHELIGRPHSRSAGSKKSAAAWCIELKIKAGRMSGLHWFLYIFHHPSPHFITVKLTGLLWG